MTLSKPLTDEEKQILLRLARQSLDMAVRQHHLLKINPNDYSPTLQEDGATFVTLTIAGSLRGCIGALEPYQPLVQDVCEHAAAAALEDYRFPPVSTPEIDRIEIEISRLTPPQALPYDTPDALLAILRPGIDGVVLRDGMRRATFLPQVWEKLPDPRAFLAHLCQKMGAPGNLWERKPLEVLTYQVEEFHK